MFEMMKCFVMHGIGKVGVMEKPLARRGPGSVSIRTKAAPICTDWRWRGETVGGEPGRTS